MITEAGYVSIYENSIFFGSQNNLHPTTGHFVIEQDPVTKKLITETLKLLDDNSRMYYEMGNVSFLWPSSNELEGKKKMYRPFVLEKMANTMTVDGEVINTINYKVISTGEKVKISYINGSIYNPLVEGAIENISVIHQHKFLFLQPDNLDRQPTRYENDLYSLEFENDGKGGLNLSVIGKTNGTGNINIVLAGSSGNGNVTVTLNGKFTLQQADGNGNILQSVILDDTPGAEKVTIADKSGNIINTSSAGIQFTGTSTKKNENAVYGGTLVSMLTSLISAIKLLSFTTANGPTTGIIDPTGLDAVSNGLNDILVK